MHIGNQANGINSRGNVSPLLSVWFLAIMICIGVLFLVPL